MVARSRLEQQTEIDAGHDPELRPERNLHGGAPFRRRPAHRVLLAFPAPLYAALSLRRKRDVARQLLQAGSLIAGCGRDESSCRPAWTSVEHALACTQDRQERCDGVLRARLRLLSGPWLWAPLSDYRRDEGLLALAHGSRRAV